VPGQVLPGRPPFRQPGRAGEEPQVVDGRLDLVGPASATGLPVSVTSPATKSAMRSSARCRCAGVVSRQAGNARRAAVIARSTSSGPDAGAVP